VLAFLQQFLLLTLLFLSGFLVFLQVLFFFLIDEALLYLGKHFKSVLDLLLVLLLQGNDAMDVDGLVLELTILPVIVGLLWLIRSQGIVPEWSVMLD